MPRSKGGWSRFDAEVTKQQFRTAVCLVTPTLQCIEPRHRRSSLLLCGKAFSFHPSHYPFPEISPLVCCSVAAYPALLHQLVANKRWEEAIRLARLVKVRSCRSISWSPLTQRLTKMTGNSGLGVSRGACNPRQRAPDGRSCLRGHRHCTSLLLSASSRTAVLSLDCCTIFVLYRTCRFYSYLGSTLEFER